METVRKIVELMLEKGTYGGDFMARLPDGRPVFAPFGIPGETAKIEFADSDKRFLKGRIVEVIQASPERLTPRCIHFGECGGCHYQHMSYEKQLELKQQIVAEQLERIGGFRGIEVKPVVPSPSPWNYRNNVQFAVDDQGRLGFQRMGSHAILPIRECHLPNDRINGIWQQLEFEAGSGIDTVTLRQSSDGEDLLILEGDGRMLPELESELSLSIVHRSDLGEILMAGENMLNMEVLDRSFQVSAGSFFQVNTEQAESLVRVVLEKASVGPDSVVVDVYCGVGLFSAFLTPKVKRLIGIEVSESACADFAVNLDEFDNVELYVGAAEDILPELKLEPDVILVDPPRAGLDAAVRKALIDSNARQIIYISCDPSTLARDLKELVSGGYEIELVQPFDMFPQTFHVETLVALYLT